MQQPLVNMSNQEIFIVLISKFSQSCNKIFSTLQFLRPHLDLRVVDIDNPKTREIVLKSGLVKSVPCIVLVTPQTNKMSFYEGNEAVQLLNRAVGIAQQKVQIEEAKKKPVSDITQILKSKPAPQADMDEEPEENKATIRGRTNPPRIKQGDGHEGMAVSSLSQMPRNAPEQMQARRQDVAPHEALGTPLDMEDDIYDANLLEDDKPQGLTKEEILGPQGGGSREEEARRSDTRSKAEAMMKARDSMK